MAASEEALFSVFVGDLSSDVDDFLLMETFRQYYGTVRSAKVSAALPSKRPVGAQTARFAPPWMRRR